jgi:hypothetical protein
MAGWTNFCCRSGGNNINAGAVDGSTTEPATTPLVTYTAGDWNATTDVFTAAVGADMTEAVVGRFASLAHDGDTTPTTNQFLVARITAVDTGARTITLSGTSRLTLGTEVATGTANRTLRIGGAWAGPAAASGFPMNQALGNLTNSSNETVRINFKNDQTYSITAAIVVTSTTVHWWGYTSAYGDGGRATLDGGTSGASYNLLTLNAAMGNDHFVDWVFQNNGATGNADLVNYLSGNMVHFYRSVFRDCRGSGVDTTSASALFVECEFFGCNQSNDANNAAVRSNSASASLCMIRCVLHDNPGSNGDGVRWSGPCVFVFCIFHGNGRHGVNVGGSRHAAFVCCDVYDNADSGVNVGNSAYLESCNVLKNGTALGDRGIEATGELWILGCGFGTGTMVNFDGDYEVAVVQAVDAGSFSYPTNANPWNDPDDGDFRLVRPEPKNTGRGTFTQTAASYSGSVGYPDIGSNQLLHLPAVVLPPGRRHGESPGSARVAYRQRVVPVQGAGSTVTVPLPFTRRRDYRDPASGAFRPAGRPVIAQVTNNVTTYIVVNYPKLVR